MVIDALGHGKRAPKVPEVGHFPIFPDETRYRPGKRPINSIPHYPCGDGGERLADDLAIVIDCRSPRTWASQVTQTYGHAIVPQNGPLLRSISRAIVIPPNILGN